MGRRSNLTIATMREQHLHTLDEVFESGGKLQILKICHICHGCATTTAELDLFIISGSEGKRGNYCMECFNTKYNAPNNSKRLSFGKSRFLVSEPRTGFCRKCGKAVENTNADFHHWRYDATKPNMFCLELCDKCHRAENINLHIHNIAINNLLTYNNLSEFFTDKPFDVTKAIKEIESEWDARYTNMLLRSKQK